MSSHHFMRSSLNLIFTPIIIGLIIRLIIHKTCEQNAQNKERHDETVGLQN